MAGVLRVGFSYGPEILNESNFATTDREHLVAKLSSTAGHLSFGETQFRSRSLLPRRLPLMNWEVLRSGVMVRYDVKLNLEEWERLGDAHGLDPLSLSIFAADAHASFSRTYLQACDLIIKNQPDRISELSFTVPLPLQSGDMR